MIFTITSAGQLAANNANNAGPKINLTSFKVSDATGFTPNPSNVSLPGNVLYSGPVTSYYVIDASRVEFTCILDETIGTFTYGSIALYLDTGTMFAISCLESPRLKKANGPSGEGDSIAIVARLNYTNLVTAFSFRQDTLAHANVLEVAGLHVLQPPAISPANGYIAHPVSKHGDGPLAFRQGDWLWGIAGWTAVGGATIDNSGTTFTNGAILSGTTDSLTLNFIGDLIEDFAVGDYIVQFVTGPFKGYCRTVSAYSTHVLSWSDPFPSAVTVGSQFILYRNIGAIAKTALSRSKTSGDIEIHLAPYLKKAEADALYKPIDWQPAEQEAPLTGWCGTLTYAGGTLSVAHNLGVAGHQRISAGVWRVLISNPDNFNINPTATPLYSAPGAPVGVSSVVIRNNSLFDIYTTCVVAGSGVVAGQAMDPPGVSFNVMPDKSTTVSSSLAIIKPAQSAGNGDNPLPYSQFALPNGRGLNSSSMSFQYGAYGGTPAVGVGTYSWSFSASSYSEIISITQNGLLSINGDRNRWITVTVYLSDGTTTVSDTIKFLMYW